VKISVITAVYNSEGTAGEAIESIARQTYPNVQHVIIEGQSADGSLAAIERAAHDRMELISEPDKGIYDALNKGIARSSGDIVGFVHSDDLLAHDQVLDRIAGAFADPAVEAVFSDLDYVSAMDTSRVIRHWSTGPFHPQRLKRGWMPPHPTLYLRRHVYERFGDFDLSLMISADYDFILRFFSKAQGQSVYIPEVLYKMRVGGVSNRSLGKIKQKMAEDYRAMQRNGVGGVPTLTLKNVSKLGQFIARQREGT